MTEILTAAVVSIAGSLGAITGYVNLGGADHIVARASPEARQDAFTARQGDELTRRINALEESQDEIEGSQAIVVQMLAEMLKYGPADVNAKLDDLLGQGQEHHKDEMAKLNDMQREQEKHFQAWPRPPWTR